MLETSGNAGNCRVRFDYVKLYIYSLPGFECLEGVEACPRPQKDVEDP
jgi:hypothetical protein